MQISGNTPRIVSQPQVERAQQPAAAGAPQTTESMPAFKSNDQFGAARETLASSRKGSSLDVPDTLRRTSRREPTPEGCTPGGLPYGPLGSTPDKGGAPSSLKSEPTPGTCSPGGLPYGPLGSTKPSQFLKSLEPGGESIIPDLLKEVKVGEGPFDPSKLIDLPPTVCPPANPGLLKEVKVGEGPFDPSKLIDLPPTICPPANPDQPWVQTSETAPGSTKPSPFKEVKVGEGPFDPSKLTELPPIVCPPENPNQIRPSAAATATPPPGAPGSFQNPHVFE